MPANPFHDRDIVSIKDFSKDDLEFIFDATDKVSQLRPSQRGELGKGAWLHLLRTQHQDTDEL
jgi:aspartate carbamoyltransferase catalytic subunit